MREAVSEYIDYLERVAACQRIRFEEAEELAASKEVAMYYGLNDKELSEVEEYGRRMQTEAS